MLWDLCRQKNNSQPLFWASSLHFSIAPFYLCVMVKRNYFLSCYALEWTEISEFRDYCFTLALSSLALASIFFPFFYSSEWESAALEHCYWCEEGYKRKTTQSDYTLMRQFMFSWTDSSLGSTDLWTALIVWGARSAWKCQITMSALLMLCWCPLVLYYGLPNFFECRKHLFREQVTCRMLLQLAWV